VHFRENIGNNIRSVTPGTRRAENGADLLEHELKRRSLPEATDPIKVFHMVRAVAIIGGIADDANFSKDLCWLPKGNFVRRVFFVDIQSPTSHIWTTCS